MGQNIIFSQNEDYHRISHPTMPRWPISTFQSILLSSYEFDAIFVPSQWPIFWVISLFCKMNTTMKFLSWSRCLGVKFQLFNPFRYRFTRDSFYKFNEKFYREKTFAPSDVIKNSHFKCWKYITLNSYISRTNEAFDLQGFSKHGV